MTPLSFSTSVSHKIGQKQANKFQNWIHPWCRPRRISPKKRVKWRLVKKWFNRYEKPRFIGMVVTVQYRVGLSGLSLITDVKIRKAGKHRLNYDISAKPITEYKELQIP